MTPVSLPRNWEQNPEGIIDTLVTTLGLNEVLAMLEASCGRLVDNEIAKVRIEAWHAAQAAIFEAREKVDLKI